MDQRLDMLPEASGVVKPAMSEPRARELLARNWVKAQPALSAFLIASTPQFSDAEDLLQEVAAEIALRFHDYDPSRPFLPWALWVAKIKIADFYRARERRQAVFIGESIDALAEACLRIQETLAEERVALERCLGQLTDRSRTLLHLRYFEDLRPQEIGARLGVEAASVRVSLSRIRTVLSKCVQASLGKTLPANG